MFSKKSSIIVLLFCTILSINSIGVSAKTLAQSFSCGSSIHSGKYKPGIGTSYYKTAWAKTKGYKPKHYVRIMIGTPSDKPKPLADSGRCWGKGDIKATCRTPQIQGASTRLHWPVAHGYYGT